MAKSRTILFQDARRALQLTAELHELPSSVSVRAHHLINGMCELLGAQNGLLGLLSEFREGGKPKILHAVTGGHVDGIAQRAYSQYVNTEYGQDPLILATVHDCKKSVSFDRRQRVTDRDWYGSPHVAEFRKQLSRVDDSIYAYFPLSEPGLVVGLGINRAWNDRPFGEREKNLIDLMHNQLIWLYRQFGKERGCGLPIAKQPLSPRLQQTLARLIAGDSEKQVANRLDLSVHTIHDYVKTLYRRFGVNSRAELLACCLSSRDADA